MTDAKLRMHLPRPLIWIAVAQAIPLLVMPPATIQAISPIIWGALALLFAFIGWSLLRRRAWARIASTFIQGFSIIVHLLILVPNAKLGTTPAAPWDFILISTSIVSIALSAVVLYYIDQPDIQALMQ